MPPPTSAARQVLQSRALQCSFSSVFHLRRAGMDKTEAKRVEQFFTAVVALPIVIIGGAGLSYNLFVKE